MDSTATTSAKSYPLISSERGLGGASTLTPNSTSNRTSPLIGASPSNSNITAGISGSRVSCNITEPTMPPPPLPSLGHSSSLLPSSTGNLFYKRVKVGIKGIHVKEFRDTYLEIILEERFS